MDYVYVHDCFSCFCPCNWGTRKRVDTAPKASGCFLGGTQEIFGAIAEHLLGGTGKAEAAKLQGAMKRVEPEAMHRNKSGTTSLHTGASRDRKRRADRFSLLLDGSMPIRLL